MITHVIIFVKNLKESIEYIVSSIGLRKIKKIKNVGQALARLIKCSIYQTSVFLMLTLRGLASLGHSCPHFREDKL
jgi:catechol 2,3-dioxygenase-like lactoylglutathione lyase family enzyme